MIKDTITYISFDTHKDFCEVVSLRNEYYEPYELRGRIPTTRHAFTKLTRKLESKHAGSMLHFV